ncbi:MAG: MFS transporter [Planctomycetes bacterium]|nr:MFS transporter [Planctomycetota bacterium]
METQTPVPWLRTRLSVQMFLQFAVWGAWAPVLGNHLNHLGFQPEQIGMVYLTAALALMISPLIAGQIADRYFATQKFLGISFILSGVFFYLASTVSEYSQVWWMALLAMLFFGPTLGLANSLCFHHLQDARKDFPIVRLFGTLGWIVAGFILSAWLKLTDRPIGDCLILGALFSILNGLYCFTLPNTPPKAEAAEKFAVGKVLAMLKDPSFALFSFIAFVLLVFATFYYNFSGIYFEDGLGLTKDQVPLVLLSGQVMEILTMFILAYMLRKWGTRFTITIGILAWGLRFFMFSLVEPRELVLASQIIHGVCFAFAVAASMLYVESICAPDVRGSMQAFLAWITYGLGMFVGSIFSGKLLGAVKGNWHEFWQIPALGCVAAAVLFAIFFRARDTQPETPSQP